nr:hypothetical protein BaRGS_027749 [Batillaria attramentaria]
MGPDGICVCKAGFKDCDDVYHYGNWTGDGVYFIQPLLSAQPFQVYCRFITNARNYIMERRKNDMEFNRPWNDYVNGFGDVDGDHFLGLENIYALTNDHKRFELRVVVKDEANDRFFENPYKETKIGNAASGYPFLFNVSAHSTLPPVGCFQSLYGAKFSTSDRDNDGVPNVHCAALREGPWWYNDASCNTCNPTGPLVRPAGGTRLGVDNEVFWTHVLGNVAPFKVTMFLVLQSEFNSCWPNC